MCQNVKRDKGTRDEGTRDDGTRDDGTRDDRMMGRRNDGTTGRRDDGTTGLGTMGLGMIPGTLESPSTCTKVRELASTVRLLCQPPTTFYCGQHFRAVWSSCSPRSTTTQVNEAEGTARWCFVTIHYIIRLEDNKLYK